MIKLNVNIEKNGMMEPVGLISGNSREDATFKYLHSYLESPDCVPISISLPLKQEEFSVYQTSTFFEGLLPEGFTRRSVASMMHVDENDYISILHGLGRECLGALNITEDGEQMESAYEIISDSQIKELAAEGVTKSTEIVTKSHLSLTGASGKAGLYYSKEDDRWYLPCGMAPSTHIVKQSHVRLDSIVTNEQLSLQTASLCGIVVPDNFIINVGNGDETEVLFATRRYDRVFSNDSQKLNGLPVPIRLHQEDFGQAMGIPSSEKYEHGCNGYMKMMFDVLRKYSSNPIIDQLRLWDIIVFNYLIGNTDAHIKNFSLIYNKNMNGIRLAPAYDIISTVIYSQSTRDMAFSIGGKYCIDEVDEKCFIEAARECGLGEKMAVGRLHNMQAKFEKSLNRVAENMEQQGYEKATLLAERILKTVPRL